MFAALDEDTDADAAGFFLFGMGGEFVGVVRLRGGQGGHFRHELREEAAGDVFPGGEKFRGVADRRIDAVDFALIS